MRLTQASFKRAASAVMVVTFLSSALLGGGDHLPLKPRTVYILPMANGLDRYLASRLTSLGVVTVVLDLESAHAVLTDRVDGAFWAWSKTRYKPTAGPSNGWFIDEDRFRYERPPMGSYRSLRAIIPPPERWQIVNLLLDLL